MNPLTSRGPHESQNDQQEIGRNLAASRRMIANLETQIEEQTQKSAAHTQSKQDELNQKLANARQDVHAAQARLKDIEQQHRERQEESDSLKPHADQVNRELQEIRTRLDGYKEQVARCREQQNNQLAPFGNRMKEVLEQISRMNWHGQRPVGPLGVYVKVKDPQKWAGLLSNVLGGYMSAFAVTDARDLAQMRKLLKDSRK